MKNLKWILIVAVVVAMLAAPGIALAQNGPHGGYLTDTDACAGCHRAHTAPSSVTWQPADGSAPRSALLLTGALRMETFCLACHDNLSQGADTDVLDGVYKGHGIYGTAGADLNSGPFGRSIPSDPSSSGLYAVTLRGTKKVTSSHVSNGGSWGAYGGGAFASTSSVIATGNYGLTLGTGSKIVMDCGTCHDPHGSSNYRILRDTVYGNAVGGYIGSGVDPDPNPFVISAEAGFPTTHTMPANGNGFRLHTIYPAYIPSYTKAQYAKAPGLDTNKGMVGWCTGCHTVYATQTSNYNAADGFGFVERHRHPMNVEMSTFKGAGSLIVTDSLLPLAHSMLEDGTQTNTSSDWIECLTCHNAHGATSVMTGWANVADPANDLRPDTGLGGVAPVPDSALLKMNNRGVCEACHNK